MQQVSGQTLDSSSMWLPSSLDFKAYLCEEKQLALHSYHTASSNGSPANSSFTLHKLHTCSEEGASCSPGSIQLLYTPYTRLLVGGINPPFMPPCHSRDGMSSGRELVGTTDGRAGSVFALQRLPPSGKASLMLWLGGREPRLSVSSRGSMEEEEEEGGGTSWEDGSGVSYPLI